MLNFLIIIGAKYLVFVVVFIAFVYAINQDESERKKLILLAVISFPTAYVMAKIGSLLYYDPRPFVMGDFAPLIYSVPDNGFPSGHTLISALIASIAYFGSQRLGVALFILALIVSLSRVLAGVHSFVDILGSVIIAFVAVWMVRYYLFAHRDSQENRLLEWRV